MDGNIRLNQPIEALQTGVPKSGVGSAKLEMTKVPRGALRVDDSRR